MEFLQYAETVCDVRTLTNSMLHTVFVLIILCSFCLVSCFSFSLFFFFLLMNRACYGHTAIGASNALQCK